MKKLLIAAGICTLPLILFGVVNPILPFMNMKEKFNSPVLFVYVIILATCIATILTAVISMTGYVSEINDLEKARKDVDEKEQKLDALIRQYNRLIINAKP